jgi:hypothetical protein
MDSRPSDESLCLAVAERDLVVAAIPASTPVPALRQVS